MFKERHIYYFRNFKFNNGNEPKDKYFIVLKETVDNIIIGTLPTRKNKIPSFVTTNHGCINIEESMYNCYLFEKNRTICTNGFCFDLPTFIYGSEIEYYSKEKLANDFNKEGLHFRVQGELTTDEYNRIVNCLKNSNSVKNGIKKKLSN